MTGDNKSGPFIGKTYSLYHDKTGTGQYYLLIRKLTNLFLQRCPDEGDSCARWMKKAHESSFNIKELEKLLK